MSQPKLDDDALPHCISKDIVSTAMHQTSTCKGMGHQHIVKWSAKASAVCTLSAKLSMKPSYQWICGNYSSFQIWSSSISKSWPQFYCWKHRESCQCSTSLCLPLTIQHLFIFAFAALHASTIGPVFP